MNLLFDFLQNLLEPEKSNLQKLKLTGMSYEVWRQIHAQISKGVSDRGRIQSALHISSGHFDKITSQLLEKSYSHLFAENTVELLSYLSSRVAFNKHYYNELNRQLKNAESTLSKKQLVAFYNTNINFIYFNLPIIHKDEKVLKRLASKYLALEKNRNAKLLIECKLMYVQIDKLFAAAKVKAQAAALQKKITALGNLPADANEELTFSFYWLKIYFSNALEDFSATVPIAEEAAHVLKKFKSDESKINRLRIELKLAELLYYLSRFDESFQKFEQWMKSATLKKIPDQSYYATKYFQVCLITNHLKEAGEILVDRKNLPPASLRQILLPRDIISFAKYFLFCENYDEAFDFIQLGFEKNPKGKYFQYEVELRNLQTAYFFLTNQKGLLVQMCNRHLKYLNAHGYPVGKSDFPHFYVLTKAMLKRGDKLSEMETEKLQRYQMGSYAVYGKLLLKMREAVSL